MSFLSQPLGGVLFRESLFGTVAVDVVGGIDALPPRSKERPTSLVGVLGLPLAALDDEAITRARSWRSPPRCRGVLSPFCGCRRRWQLNGRHVETGRGA